MLVRKGIAQGSSILFAATFTVLIILHWHHAGELIQGGDNFFGYDPANELRKGFAVWNHFGDYLGGAWSSGTWAPWLIVSTALTHALGSGWAQIGMIAMMELSALLGAYRLCRVFGASPTAATISALAYDFNPWTQLFAGLNYPVDWLLALLPWYGIFLVKGTRHVRLRGRATFAIAALSFCALSVIGANPGLVGAFILACAAFVYVAHAAGPEIGARRWLLRTTLVSAVASSWWLFLIARQFLSAHIATPTSPSEWSFVVTRASLLNVLRLNPLWGWSHPEYFPYAAAYDRNAITYFAGFLPFVLLCVALALCRSSNFRFVRAASLVSLIGLFLTKGIHEPLGWVNGLLYHLPLMGLFREPTSKFPIISLAMFLITSAAAVDEILARASRLRRPGLEAVCALTLTAGTLASALPMVIGAQFHGYTPNYHPGFPGLPPQYVRLSDDWVTLQRVLVEARDSSSGVLILPGDTYYQADYDWGYYGADYLPTWLLHQPVMIPGLSGYTTTDVQGGVEARILSSFHAHASTTRRFLSDLGFRWIVYRNDVRASRAPFQEVRSSDVREAIGKSGYRRIGNLELYDLGSPNTRISFSTQYSYSAVRNVSAADGLELRALTERIPRIVNPNVATSTTHSPAILELSATDSATDPGLLGALLPGVQTRVVAHRPFLGSAFPLFAPSRKITVEAEFLADRRRLMPTTRQASEHKSLSGAIVLLTPERLYTDENGVQHFDLFNPTSNVLVTDFRLAVAPGNAGVATLWGGSQIMTAQLGPAKWPRYASFKDVSIPPGRFSYLVRVTSPQSPIRLVPDRAPRMGDFQFDAIVPHAAASTQCSRPASCGRRLLGEISLDQALTAAPLLKLPPGVSDQYDEATVSVVTKSGPIVCQTSIFSTELDLRTALEECGQYNPVRTLQWTDARVRSIALFSSSATSSGHADDRLDLRLYSLFHVIDWSSLAAPTLHPDSGHDILMHQADGSYVLVTQSSGSRARGIATNHRHVVLTLGRFPATTVVRGFLLGSSDSRIVILKDDGTQSEYPLSAVDHIDDVDESSWLAAVELSYPLPVDASTAWLDISGDLPIAITLATGDRQTSTVDPASEHGDAELTAAVSGPIASAMIKLLMPPGSRQQALKMRFATDTKPMPLDLYFSGTTARTLSLHFPSDHSVATSETSAISNRVSFQLSGSDDRLSTLAVGTPPQPNSEVSVPSGSDIVLGAQLIKNARPGFWLMNETFSGDWSAVQLWPTSFLPHLLVDGWRNGWFTDRAGPVLIFNLSVVLQFALLALGGITVIRLWVRRAAI